MKNATAIVLFLWTADRERLRERARAKEKGVGKAHTHTKIERKETDRQIHAQRRQGGETETSGHIEDKDRQAQSE